MAAEPALGPVTYIHRESASENPSAPLSHHLQDSTHTSFGVVTTGFVIDRFKIEASAFNGHEPDEDRCRNLRERIQKGDLSTAPVALERLEKMSEAGRVGMIGGGIRGVEEDELVKPME